MVFLPQLALPSPEVTPLARARECLPDAIGYRVYRAEGLSTERLQEQIGLTFLAVETCFSNEGASKSDLTSALAQEHRFARNFVISNNRSDLLPVVDESFEDPIPRWMLVAGAAVLLIGLTYIFRRPLLNGLRFLAGRKPATPAPVVREPVAVPVPRIYITRAPVMHQPVVAPPPPVVPPTAVRTSLTPVPPPEPPVPVIDPIRPTSDPLMHTNTGETFIEVRSAGDLISPKMPGRRADGSVRYAAVELKSGALVLRAGADSHAAMVNMVDPSQAGRVFGAGFLRLDPARHSLFYNGKSDGFVTRPTSVVATYEPFKKLVAEQCGLERVERFLRELLGSQILEFKILT